MKKYQEIWPVELISPDLNSYDGLRATEARLCPLYRDVEELLQRGADPNYGGVQASEKITPLMAASRDGFPEIVKLLLANGAEVNVKGWREFTPLKYARKGRKAAHREIERLLLNAGAVE